VYIADWQIVNVLRMGEFVTMEILKKYIQYAACCYYTLFSIIVIYLTSSCVIWAFFGMSGPV
jgi:hypothetical protein